jgi:phospholipid/cholesterol/gamma-HCH transport system substrate-binding protein
VALTLDSVGIAIRKLLDDPAIGTMLGNLEQASGSLSEKLSASGDLTKTLASLQQFSEGLNAKTGSLQTTITHLEEITGELKDAHLDSLVMNLNKLSTGFSNIASSIENGEGTVGKLINEESLYQQIDQLVSDLDSLITDVNENPKKYVSFSLIGK